MYIWGRVEKGERGGGKGEGAGRERKGRKGIHRGRGRKGEGGVRVCLLLLFVYGYLHLLVCMCTFS